MLHNTQENKNKEKKNYFIHWLQSLSGSGVESSHVCNGDVCSIKPPQQTTFGAPSQSSFTYFTNMNEEGIASTEESFLASILPKEYYEAMQQAAKQGFLYAFISSIPEEVFCDYFKQRKLTAEQIQYANQSLRAVTVLALSAYLGLLDTKTICTVIGVPLASFGLKQYAGFNNTFAQLLPVGFIIANEIRNDLSNTPKLLMTLLSGIGAGFIGSQTAKTGSHFTRNSLFGLKEKINELISADQIPVYSSQQKLG